ncbi:MAG: XRE family transcriptional regulator, partial [Roseococcus sp.]|nr:XRE family transcriptional regulator [Roseococcus sp.]
MNETTPNATPATDTPGEGTPVADAVLLPAAEAAEPVETTAMAEAPEADAPAAPEPEAVAAGSIA